MYSAVVVGFINQPPRVLNVEIYGTTERKMRYDAFARSLTYYTQETADIDKV